MNKVTISVLREFFFDGMQQGWAAKGEKTTIPQLPGAKAITYRDGNLCLVDYYFADKRTGRSAGSTVIWFRDEPAWIMHYGGYYPKGVIPFLKAALNSAYQDRIFYGGRGPVVFKEKEGPLVYFNGGALDDFARFKGREEILRAGEIRRLGWHEFCGMALI